MKSVFRKEILENITTYRFYVLTALLLVLMIVSLIVSYGDYRLRMENYNVLRPQGSEVNKIILAPQPLSIFAKGLDANIGRLYSLSALGIEVHSSQQSINRLFSLFTVPDMLFVIRVILAFIAVLFSFDVICGEKEQGTLKLMLASGAKRGETIAAKLLGRFVLVFVPFALLFFAGAVIVSLLPDVAAGTTYWGGIALIGAASAIYVMIWIALGAFVSTLVHRSASAMVLGLAFWVVFVFVIPNLGVTVAQSVRGVPPSDRVEMENRLAAIQSIYETLQRVKATGDQRDFARIMTQIREANSQQFEQYMPKLNGLIALTRGIVRLSPAGAVELFVTDIGRTGLSEDLRLKNAVWLYIDRNFKRLGGIEKDPAELFRFEDQSFGAIFAESSFVDSGILVVFCAGFVLLALWRFLRYDPR
jgi:ABC-type transport system involved in multi-copper enzyme maturation permease subunit